MNRTLYIPAISTGCLYDEMITDKLIKEKSMRFFNKENSIFHYDKIMFSAGHNYKKPNLVKEILKIDLTKTLVMGDSGGYQITTDYLEYSDEIREKIFDWLEENTNYSPNLDIPPFISSSKGNRRKTFEECLEMSFSNFQWFETHQSNKTKFMNVLQGRSIDQLITWYQKVKDFNFSGGWAIGSVSRNIFLTLYALIMFLESGEFDRFNSKGKIFHIFGATSYQIMRMLIYFQHKLNQLGYKCKISYDSSSPILSSAFGSYKTSIFKSSKLTITKQIDSIDHLNLDIPLPCDCPVCEGLTWRHIYQEFNEKNQAFTTRFYSFLSLHNLYHFIKDKTELENILFLNSKEIIRDIFPRNDIFIFTLIDKIFDLPKGKKLDELIKSGMVFNKFEEDTIKHDLKEIFE